MADQNEKEKVPTSFIISRQLDQEKIGFLTKRIDDLLKSNSSLRSNSNKNEKDTHDIVLYFQREMEMKDEIIARLNEELVKRETQLKFEVEKLKKKYTSEMNTQRLNSEAQILDLTSQVTALESELRAVEVFRKDKVSYDEKIEHLQKQLEVQRQHMLDSLENQERKYIEKNAQNLKDLDEQKAAFREIALRDARQAMGEEANRILTENDRMREELKFHQSVSSDLQAEKNSLASQLSVARREVAILTEKELEYAKQAHFKTKEIKALRDRVEQLEKASSLNVEKFKQRAKELKATVAKDLEDATMDAAGLRRLLKIKNKELRHMKELAATIISQRNETEQFFLESLQEVKEIIRHERRRNSVDTKVTVNKLKTGSGVRMKVSSNGNGNGNGNVAANSNGSPVLVNGNSVFPPLNVKGSNLHHLDTAETQVFPLHEHDMVTIQDLSWEDKELVLRVLFAKMNGNQKKTETILSKGRESKGLVMPSEAPVFLSEGLNLPPSESVKFQSNFEVHYHEESENDGDDLEHSMDSRS